MEYPLSVPGPVAGPEIYSKPFEELQIIKPEFFDMAQALMTQRTNENKEYWTISLNTTGQSLLSGNIFCGHCGGRLTLTTNGKVCRQADGTSAKKKRIRYICYNKTRHRAECDGQTGYRDAGLVDELPQGMADAMAKEIPDEVT